jgi:Class III cytochrome C family
VMHRSEDQSMPASTRGGARLPVFRAYRWVSLFALGLFALFTPSLAQISPGSLSKPHQSLNGATNCTSCHKFGGQAALKCLDCHNEISSRVSAHKGLHATYNIPPGSSRECARCHSEHNGEDFPLDLTGEICTKWNERESTWRKSGSCQSRGTSQSRS